MEAYEYEIGESRMKVSEPRFIGRMVEVISEYLKVEKNALQETLMKNFMRAFHKFI